MKKFIKDEKIYASPIKIKTETETIFSSDPNVLKQYGYEVYETQDVKPSLEDLIESSNKYINQKTDERILNDFIWKDHEFYLTMENQQNFANMFISREFLHFPQTVKTKTGFAEIENIVELSGFYISGVTFVKECLEQGWKEKAEAEAKIREDYK